MVATQIALESEAPPGSYGLPLIGRIAGTIEFFAFGWERYFTRRRKRFGSSVFRVNLFQPTIAVLDPVGIEPLFGDPHLIQDYGFSWAVPPRALVGHVVPSVFEHGPAHDNPKAFILELVTARRAALVPVFDRVADEFLARWTRRQRFAWADEIEDFAASFVFEWVLGDRPEIAAVRRIYNNIFQHPWPSLEALFPGSNYARSLIAYRHLIRFIERTPRFAEIVDSAAAHGIAAEAVPHRLAFLLGMNSFLGLQSTMKSIVGELSRRPELAEMLRDRLRGLSVADILADPLLDGFLREVLRMHPPVFFVFGRATRDMTLATADREFAISKGELVMGVIPFAQRDPAAFAEPARFDIGRYADPTARHGLIWARGRQDKAVTAQDRTCPGKDPAILVAKLFCARLVFHRWHLDKAPVWSRRHFGLNVAAPKGQLSVTGFEAVS